MDYIHRLPFIISASSAVVIGGLSYKYDIPAQETYVKMALGMVVFFFLGVYIRNTVEDVKKHAEMKKEEMERQKEIEALEALKEMERLKEEITANEETIKKTADNKPTIDLSTEGLGEDFSPLTVSEIINTRPRE